MESGNKNYTANYVDLYHKLLSHIDASQNLDEQAYATVVADQLQQLSRALPWLGQEVIVDTNFYLLLDGSQYSVHSSAGSLNGKAAGLRFDPQLEGALPTEDIRLLLSIESCGAATQYVPLPWPDQVVVL